MTAFGKRRIRRHILVSGRVQGVWFRESTRQQASRLHVSGWVRNLPDGRVEAVFEGSQAAVQEMMDWCRRGPPNADVEGIQEIVEDPEGLEGFHVHR